jgi:hypothetical protein
MKQRTECYYLPKKYIKRHDYCEFVINQIEQLITEEKFVQLKEQIIEFLQDLLKEVQNSDNHIFDILAENNLTTELNDIVRTNLILSLLIETCYFVQESLLSSLKMRMTVCFTLLRKPFLEIYILLMRILNETDFIDKFNNLENFDPVKTTPAQKKDLIAKTNELLKNNFHNEDLFDYIYNKDFGDSLFNVTNNAIHLYTNRNALASAGNQNLNFVFSKQEDINSIWEYIYNNIPVLLSFFAFLTDLLVFKSTSVHEDVFLERHKMREKMKKKYKIN